MNKLISILIFLSACQRESAMEARDKEYLRQLGAISAPLPPASNPKDNVTTTTTLKIPKNKKGQVLPVTPP